MSFHDAASLVVARLKLDQEIPPKVIEETQSALRVMKYKHPSGTFAKNDNDLKRACALLEYIAREKKGIKIPTAQLARAAYMRERDFLKFHKMIGNFRSKSEGPGSRPDTRKARKSVSSLPALAIKLGSYVHDSSGSAARAQKLYNDIRRFSRKNPHQVRDMNQFQKVYEAVCFYIMATKSLDNTGRAGSSTNADDDEGQRLTISTLVELSNDFTLVEFKSVLAHVDGILENMNEGSSGNDASKGQTKAAKASAKSASRKRQRESGVSNTESSIDNNVTLPKRARPAQLLSTQELVKSATQDLLGIVKDKEAGELDDDPFSAVAASGDNSDQDLSVPKEFLQWKERIIKNALQSMGESDTKDAENAASKQDGLEQAAIKVLERYNLLPCA